MNPTEPDRNNPSDGAARRAENLARASGMSRAERWFRSVVQSSSDIVAIFEDDGTIRYMSPAVERILGYRPEELVGTSAFNRVHPEDIEQASKSLAEVLETGGGIPPVELRVQAKDGSWRHMEAILNNLLDDPAVGGIVFNSRDITERKEAEEEKIRQARNTRLRADVSAALAESGTLQSTLQQCTEAMVKHLDAAFARVWTLNEEESVLELRASAGMYTHTDGPHGRVPLGELKIGLIAQERQPHLTNTVTSDPRLSDKEWAKRQGMVAFAGYPLIVEDRLVGVMAMFAREALAEDTVEALASVADAIAQGIERKRAEETVRRSEKSLAEAQRVAHIGNWEYEVEKDQARWSGEMYRIFGFSPGEFVPTYRAFLGLLHPDDKEFIRRSVREALRSGKRRSVEYRIVRPDGAVRSVHTEYEVLRDESGKPKRLIGTVHDITEHKRAEEEIRRLSHYNRTLFEANLAALMTLDAEGTITDVNRSTEEITGFSREELIGTDVFSHFQDPQRAREWFREVLSEGAVRGYELDIRNSAGRITPVSYNATVYRNERGEVAGVLASARDITDRRRAEEALKESEERFRSLIQNVSDVIVILEADGTVRYDSPAVESVLGYQPGERIGTSGFGYIHPEDLERVRGTFAEALVKPGVQPPIEFRIRHKDGSWRHVETTRNNLLDDPSVRGVVTTLRDVTERQRAEEALRESEERYRTLMEQSVEAIYLYDAQTKRVLESNAAFQQMVGYSEEELLGMEIYDFIAHERENIDAHIQRSLREKRRHIGERLYRRKNGSVIVVDTSASVISYNGKTALCAVSRDVTERKRTEEVLKESEERFRALIQNSSDIITLLRADGIIRYESPSVERILGYRPEEMVGENTFYYVHPEDLGRVERAFSESLKDPRRRPPAEYRFRHKDGSWVWLESVGTNLLDDPRVGEYVLNSRDVTRRRWMEEALRKSEWQMAEAQRLAHVGSWEWDIHSNTVSWSDELYRIFGLSKDVDITYEVFLQTIHPADREFVSGVIQAACENHAPYAFSHRIVRPDGTVRWLRFEGVVAVDEAGSLESLHGMTQDITELRQAEEQLRHQASHDALTDLPNRNLFMDRLGQALRRTRRKKGHQVAVLFMDLDDFKAINDSLGHELGDLLLVIMAQRLRRCLRPEDTLARFGGDEFVMLMEDIESPEDAVRVAERIVEGLREPFIVDGRELFLRASIGVALGTARQKSPEDLLRDADTAMYRAKEEELAYRVFDPAMYERVLRRLESENDIRRAIEAEEFVVHYQPIVKLENGEIWGVEALVRWNHPERGLLDPEEFVAVAEESGMVVPMGEAVLEEACRQGKEWQEEHPRVRPLVMSVNLSARQLQRPDIAQTVDRVLEKTGFQARYLRLDITETVYIKALEGNTAALDELKRMGVRISIDDFGTGYSSLAYLKRLPANALKVDKSFVKGLGEDLEDTAIVRMVIELAYTLGMEVIAEGVESEAQATLLKEMGCDMAQGFYFSEPLREEAAPRFLAK